MENKPEDLQMNLLKLKDIKEVQCSKGNYDFDEYMSGMANGLILAVSIMEDTEPKYFDLEVYTSNKL